MQYSIIAADAKEFVVIMQISLFCHIKCLNLDEMTAGSLYSSIGLFLRDGSIQKNVLKMLVFS